LDLGRDPGTLGPFVVMDDPLADEYIVRDISPDRGHHRWAFLHPELKFRVEDARHLKLIAEFAIPEITFKVTGPVTVSCAVNGHSLGSIRYDRAGDFRLEKAVPDGVVKPGEDAHVTFEAQPRWVSPRSFPSSCAVWASLNKCGKSSPSCSAPRSR
jgi:hypothetical protein